jgi:hypothetical protein
MIVRLLLLECFVFWHCWRWDTFRKRYFRSIITSSFVHIVSRDKYVQFLQVFTFTKRESGEGEHASIIQKGKMERTFALLVNSACLALGGDLRFETSFFGTRDLGRRKALFINIGRRWGLIVMEF